MSDVAARTVDGTHEPRADIATPRAIAFWAQVETFVLRHAARLPGLVFHGLGPLAGDVLESRGTPLPAPVRRERERARVMSLTTPFLLERVRAACAGPILVTKGPEVAHRYPGGARAYGDIDLLVPDAQKSQRELLAAGFEELDDPHGMWFKIHHLPPVRLRGSPLVVEVHSRPKWPAGIAPPTVDELMEAAAPSVVRVDGVLAPRPEHHALLLAAHAWAHQPLGRMRDLVDVGAFRLEAEAAVLERSARAWGVMRLWETYSDALDAVLERQSSLPLALWARHVRCVREQTVLETHLERILAPLWGYPSSRALRLAGTALANEVRPAFDEDWREKARRVGSALRRPTASVGEHRRMLGDSARRGVRLGGPADGGDAEISATGAPDATQTARTADRGDG